MTAICLPIDAQNGAPAFPAAQHRVALGAIMAGRTDRPLGAVSGVRPGSDPTITATSATWTVTPFDAIIDPDTALTVGAYLVAFTADTTGTRKWARKAVPYRPSSSHSARVAVVGAGASSVARALR